MNPTEKHKACLGCEGYEVIEEIISPHECTELIEALPKLNTSGTRTLLSNATVRALVGRIRSHRRLQRLLGTSVAVQCTFFRKTRIHNWSVSLHRDVVIPVKGCGPWSRAGTKEGMRFVRPPRAFMDRCVAVRLHLDGAPEGDLTLVPDSHRTEDEPNRDDAIPIIVPGGGGLAIRPTIAHASAKLQAAEHRRVLHYLFAPDNLPAGYNWYDAV